MSIIRLFMKPEISRSKIMSICGSVYPGRQNCISWGSAIFLHLFLLFLLMLIPQVSRQRLITQSINVTWTNLKTEEQFQETPLLIKSEVSNQSGQPASSSYESLQQIFNQPVSPAPQVDVLLPADPLLFAENPTPVEAHEFGEFAEVTTNTIAGIWHLAGLGDGIDRYGAGSGGFMSRETKPNDQRIVYVVDASASMNHKHDSAAKTRFGRVKVELFRSIESLSPEQEFCVYFFNENSTVMSPGYCVMRGQDRPMKLYEWIATFRAFGQTQPLASLEACMRQNPDLVYFLTDGLISRRDLDKASRLNQGKARICTICIGSNSSEKQLRELSELNHGTFTYVP